MILKSFKSPKKVFVAIDFPWLNRYLNKDGKMRINTNGNVFSVAVQLALQSNIDETGKVITKKMSIDPRIEGHIFYDDVENANREKFAYEMQKFEKVGLTVFPVRRPYLTSEREHRDFFASHFWKHTVMAIESIKYDTIIIVSGNKDFARAIKNTKKSIYFFADDTMKDIPNSQWKDVREINWYKIHIENLWKLETPPWKTSSRAS